MAEQTDKQEFPIRGPFAGVVSDAPSDMLEEMSGFADVSDIIFRKGVACSRPAYNQIATMPLPLEPVIGMGDFFSSDANRNNLIITPTRVFYWSAGAARWTQLAGALSGAAGNLFTTATVAHKFLFCQGIDKVKVWDGFALNFSDVSPNAVPARYLMELGGRLIAAFTTEAGTPAPQRFRYTGLGDPTDWTSFSAGIGDLYNDLGPITGALKLYQAGYLWQQWGITQLSPTGLVARPFDIVAISAHSKGNICPNSLASFGEMEAPYVGKDNIYSFNGSVSDPIGDLPIEGSRVRTGARKRIFSDLQTVDLLKVFGLVSTSINGNDFNAYWLFIPNVCTWVFNFDERNWTRFTWDKIPSSVGTFQRRGVTRIQDLQGPIYAQSWSPSGLQVFNPLDSLLVAFTDGTLGNIDWTGFAEGGFSLLSGQLFFKDKRNKKSIESLRIVYTDIGQVTINITIYNERREFQTKPYTFGSGTGDQTIIVVPFPKITGVWFKISITGSGQTPFCFSEIAPLYRTLGEFTV